MDLIKAKQVEGAMDLNSNQSVSGAKSFTGGASIMVCFQDAIYWCQRENVLEELGNSRLRMSGGSLILESFNGTNWTTG